ncbi:MAG: hypothetical protein JSR83_00240 [Proteobacteria bacterium]|nr:hypothetical protein [Pseudomonadota bacterium]
MRRNNSKVRQGLVETLRDDLRVVEGGKSIIDLLLKFYVDPGFSAVVKYRLSSYFFWKGGFFRLLSKMLWKNIIKRHSCYLSPRSHIGKGLCLPHAIGIVVGDGVEIGQGVTIFQNVTLGLGGGSDTSYPVVGDGVVIYAGACVVGDVSVGSHSRVGANAVVVRSVADGDTVGGVPARTLQKRT